MSVAFTESKRSVYGTDRIVYGTLVFSGNYATGGEAVTAATFGLTTLRMVIFDGIAVSTDVATGNPVKYNAATGKIVQYEGSAAGTALSEKTNSEAYATGSNVSCLVIGS